MRLIEFWEWERKKNETGAWYSEPGPVQVGKFHAFGMESDEVENGAMIWSTAIIECDNGELKNIPVGHCRFITGAP